MEIMDIETPSTWKSKKIEEWTVDDVFSWATDNDGVGLPEEIGNALKSQQVRGKSLKNISSSFDFERCGIPVGPAIELFTALSTIQPKLNQDTIFLDMPTDSESNEWLNCEFLLKAKIALPISEGRMFIREHYNNIQAIIESSLEKRFQYLIIGTPGIGKSCFLVYLLCQLLKANRTVVLQRSTQKHQIYLFKGGGGGMVYVLLF
eukprot:TRINITY_DN265_c0_g2_i1.p2 TRINITY_DN265_c0_g2~~TRINITY_DN265_c0_g2_i1.p2  ORF type:complete len:205 (+),score=27.12 TRINITY_DN265_c0_g2_i1:21-635(+)